MADALQRLHLTTVQKSPPAMSSNGGRAFSKSMNLPSPFKGKAKQRHRQQKVATNSRAEQDTESSYADLDEDFSFSPPNANQQSKDQRKLARSANHLLNFQYQPHTPSTAPAPLAPLHQKKRSIQALAFKRERFLQANFRFIVSPDNYSENIADADSVIDWESIEQVVCPITADTDCVICLEKPTCARIAKCGHLTCWSCMLRYFTYSDGKQSMPCPVCLKEKIMLQDLKSVSFVHLPKYSTGNEIKMSLLHRYKHSTTVSICTPTSQPGVQEVGGFTQGYGIPTWGDSNSSFNRLNLTFDSLPMVDQEDQELEAAIKLADSSRDDSLPFLLNARDLLLAKSVAIEKIQRDFLAKVGLPKAELDFESVSDTQESYFFYQCADGQQLFLHPINVKWLVIEYGLHSNFPASLAGKIIDIEDNSQTELTRKRYKYLGHLPISCGFKFCLIQLNSDVLQTPNNLKGFEQDLARRAERVQYDIDQQEKQLARSRAIAQAEAEAQGASRMVLHYSDLRPLSDEPLDLDSKEAFPSVGPASAATASATSPPLPAPEPSWGAWGTRSPTVKEDFPTLGASRSAAGPQPVAGPQPARPQPPSGAWGASPQARAAPPKQPPTQTPPATQPKRGKKQKVVLMSHNVLKL